MTNYFKTPANPPQKRYASFSRCRDADSFMSVRRSCRFCADRVKLRLVEAQSDRRSRGSLTAAPTDNKVGNDSGDAGISRADIKGAPGRVRQ